MMMHLTVEDVVGWHTHVSEILKGRNYRSAKCQAPQREDYGALVAYIWDPSGVLWHLAELD